jgi:arsenate reductase
MASTQNITTIWHNPRCAKSRETLKILTDAGKNIQVVEYLKHAPSKEDLQKILALLKKSAPEILRKKEPAFKELGLHLGQFSDEELIEVMIDNPELIERPIVIHGQKAVIARPPEEVLSLF